MLLFASSLSGAAPDGLFRASPVPTGFQRMARRQAVEKSRMTSAKHGEDCALLQRLVTKRAAKMLTSADMLTSTDMLAGVGGALPSPRTAVIGKGMPLYGLAAARSR